MKGKQHTVVVIGGAGYVGAVLVPKLIALGHRVTVLDLFIYGEEVLSSVRGNSAYRQIKGDMRDRDTVRDALEGCTSLIHLACISNDPSFELDPALGKSINFDCLPMIIDEAKRAKVERFIFASSSSVYGVKETPNVTEDLSLEPLTDYSKYKAMSEALLLDARGPKFPVLILRPATVCGYSPRLRLDLTVNILTNHAVNKGRIRVLGGAQMRPNIHIDDMADLYCRALEWEVEKIDGRVYNAGYDNHTVDAIATMVREEVGEQVEIDHEVTNDNRSYHISSEKISRELGFKPRRTIRDAIRDLRDAFAAGRVPNSFDDSRYYNIKRMQELALR